MIVIKSIVSLLSSFLVDQLRRSTNSVIRMYPSNADGHVQHCERC